MSQPDFEQARLYAIERLENELPPEICYHTPWHTIKEVLPAVERIAASEQIEGEDLIVLKTAALFHDLGFVLQYKDHEAASARIAGEALPQFGYSPEQIAYIQQLILATRLPQSPGGDLLAQILADADLDVLGREDYLTRNNDLRREMAKFGKESSDEDWYSGQLRFARAHTYFTQAAHLIRDDAKQRNIQAVARLLKNSEKNESEEAA